MGIFRTQQEPLVPYSNTKQGLVIKSSPRNQNPTDNIGLTPGQELAALFCLAPVRVLSSPINFHFHLPHYCRAIRLPCIVLQVVLGAQCRSSQICFIHDVVPAEKSIGFCGQRWSWQYAPTGWPAPCRALPFCESCGRCDPSISPQKIPVRWAALESAGDCRYRPIGNCRRCAGGAGRETEQLLNHRESPTIVGIGLKSPPRGSR